MPQKLPVTNLQESSIRVLSGVSLFQGLPPSKYRIALDTSDIFKFTADEVIFREGDESNGLYIVLAGGVIIETSVEGQLNRMKAGDLIGELGLLCHVLRTANAKAGGAGAILLHVRQEHLEELQKIEPSVYSAILRNIAEYLAKRVIELTE